MEIRPTHSSAGGAYLHYFKYTKTRVYVLMKMNFTTYWILQRKYKILLNKFVCVLWLYGIKIFDCLRPFILIFWYGNLTFLYSMAELLHLHKLCSKQPCQMEAWTSVTYNGKKAPLCIIKQALQHQLHVALTML